jgi:heme-degrading monooxygenase HmoA
MISVFVTFQYGNDFDHERVAKVASEARTMFEGMPGLRSKVFTVDDAAHCATNVYVWDDESAARAFFSDALKERVTGLYGVAPTVAFAEVLELVDNARV